MIEDVPSFCFCKDENSDVDFHAPLHQPNRAHIRNTCVRGIFCCDA
jgi:hypothetical protein